VPDTRSTIRPGDVVTLDVNEGAAGLSHADTNGRFEVQSAEGQRLHVTPENAAAPLYAIDRAHATPES